MLKLSHSMLVFLSGCVWMVVGAFLLIFGLNLVTAATLQEGNYPLMDSLAFVFGGKEQSCIVLIVLSLLIGRFKGKFVLSKAAQKGIERIATFSNPTSLANIYSRKYYILLGSMILLGMSIKFFNVPNDIRGFVDAAIGSALVTGSMVYFHAAYTMRKAAAAHL